MPQTAPAERSGNDFAGLLASLASPPRPAGPEWNDDGLADDIATLSYEPALRAHRGFPSADPSPEAGSESRPSPPDRNASTSSHCTIKRASITIRLTEPECAQMRSRAAEAGLTVSAYLRSCAFEVETLRTQVKEMLAQVRESAPAPTPQLSSLPKPWFRFWPFGRRSPIGGRPA